VTDDRLALIVELRAAPGRARELREAVFAIIGPTRTEDGCLLYDLHEDVADPDVLAFYEIWATPAHHAAHDATEHITSFVARLPELTAEPPRVLRLRRIEPAG
jgi:quinol monooxygenase YgiN